MAAINRELEFLRTMLNFAVTNGYLEQNPFHAGKGKSIIDRPAENRREREAVEAIRDVPTPGIVGAFGDMRHAFTGETPCIQRRHVGAAIAPR
jgi:hypothetical protein